MYGWHDGAKARPHAPSRQAQWVNGCLRKANIPESDWFRLAQCRESWKKLVYQRFPPEKVDRNKEIALDQWAPRIPDFAVPDPLDPLEEEENVGGSEEEVGDVRRGRPQHQAWRAYRQPQRPGAPIAQRQQRANRNADGPWGCPPYNFSAAPILLRQNRSFGIRFGPM